jgi:hypothetical protein
MCSRWSIYKILWVTKPPFHITQKTRLTLWYTGCFWSKLTTIDACTMHRSHETDMCKRGCLDVPLSCFGSFEKRRCMCVRACVRVQWLYQHYRAASWAPAMLKHSVAQYEMWCDWLCESGPCSVLNRVGNYAFTERAEMHIIFGRPCSDETAVRQLVQGRSPSYLVSYVETFPSIFRLSREMLQCLVRVISVECAASILKSHPCYRKRWGNKFFLNVGT